MLAKGFLTDNLGHTFLIDTRMEPLSAQKKKKSGKSQLDWRLSFQISCPLYSPIRIYPKDVVKYFLSKLVKANNAV